MRDDKSLIRDVRYSSVDSFEMRVLTSALTSDGSAYRKVSVLPDVGGMVSEDNVLFGNVEGCELVSDRILAVIMLNPNFPVLNIDMGQATVDTSVAK